MLVAYPTLPPTGLGDKNPDENRFPTPNYNLRLLPNYDDQ